MTETTSLNIFLFATLKELAGKNNITLQVNLPSTVAEIRQLLAAEYPALAAGLPSAIAALNHEFAQDDEIVTGDDEVAFFPPVSGGSGAYAEVVILAEEPIDLNDLTAKIVTPDTGAVALFSGYVRGATQTEVGTQQTDYLEYTAYAPMATAKMHQVIAEIRQKWAKVQGIAIVQRIGYLEVGQPTVLIACAAAHRHDGCFDAAQFGIDRLKEIVPVWKKEVSPAKSAWVEGHYQPTAND